MLPEIPPPNSNRIPDGTELEAVVGLVAFRDLAMTVTFSELLEIREAIFPLVRKDIPRPIRQRL